MSLIQGTLKSAKNAKNNTDTNNADDILIKWTSKYFSTNRKTVKEPNEKQAISKWRSIALYILSYEIHPIGKEVDHIPYKIAEKKCVATTYDKDKNIVLITFDINTPRHISYSFRDR